MIRVIEKRKGNAVTRTVLAREGVWYVCTSPADIRRVREHGERVAGILFERIPEIPREKQILLNKLKVC
jgi:(2Fe-2S) ferredoxin